MTIFFAHSNELWRILRTTRSATSRILSLVVLLLSLAPLGSIYILFSSMKLQLNEQQGKPHLAGVIDFGEFEVQFEKVWVALWDGRQPSEQTALALGPTIFSGHFRVVLPWLISIFLGVVVPACLSIASFVWSNYSAGESQDDRSEKALNRRRRKLEKRLKGFSVVLEENHILQNYPNSQAQKTENYDAGRRHQWMVPRPGESIASDTTKFRVVSEECAICREPYQVGETIVWSPNTTCVHCFHADCIKPWLLRHSPKSQGCPCCRQQFVQGQLTAPSAVCDECTSPGR